MTILYNARGEYEKMSLTLGISRKYSEATLIQSTSDAAAFLRVSPRLSAPCLPHCDATDGDVLRCNCQVTPQVPKKDVGLSIYIEQKYVS